ncbi:MAG: amidohydrolase family protein [Parvibaculaceae bacterium]
MSKSINIIEAKSRFGHPASYAFFKAGWFGASFRSPLAGPLATVFALVASACTTVEVREPVDLAIRNVTVISPERAAPLKNVDVLVNDGRIISIERGSDYSAAQEIDGSGRFLTPGLIDSHVHLYHATGLNRRYTQSFDELYEAFQEQQPRSYLYFGYTTVIELNADIDSNDRFQSAAVHPDLVHCGQGLVLSNDFMATDFDSEAEFLAAFPNFLHDRFMTPVLPDGFLAADHTPTVTVARIAESGGRCVKMYYEEALWWPSESRPPFGLPSAAIVREVVDAAHALGMPVVLHGTTPAAYKLAADAGIDVLAHGLWDWENAFLGHDDIPNDAEEAIEEVASADIHIQPTMQTIANTASLFTPDLLDDPNLSKVLPTAYVDYLRTDAQRGREAFIQRNGPILEKAFARGEAASDDPEKMARAYFTRLQRVVTRLNTRGVPFLFGTDTAVGGPGWGNPPGLNGYWEMRNWAQAGVTLESVFEAATLNNAEMFGLADELGSVQIGKRANLLLMSQNPLDSIAAYDSIDMILLNGVVLDRSMLTAGGYDPMGLDAKRRE